MAEQSTTVNRGGMGLLGWVFVVFLVLKLGVGDTSVQDWSWWWVTAPLWGGFALALVFLVVGFIVIGIGSLIDGGAAKRRRNTRRAINDYSDSLTKRR